MDIILKSGNETLNVHCYGDGGDSTDYTLCAKAEDGTECRMIFVYDDEWYSYIEEHPEESENGDAWEWLICNKQPDYIYIDNVYHTDFEIVKVENINIL